MNRFTMNTSDPTDAPHSPATPPRRKFWRRFLLGLLLGFVALVLLGFIRWYSFPSSSMNPTFQKQDVILMEGISYLFEKPKRGDLIVFKTDGIPNLNMASGLSGQTYAKRLAGLPGEELRIADGKLYVNGTHVPLTNAGGEIKIEVL